VKVNKHSELIFYENPSTCLSNNNKFIVLTQIKGTPVGGSRKVGRSTLFGECGKRRKKEGKR
jgi:hypothetical protein